MACRKAIATDTTKGVKMYNIKRISSDTEFRAVAALADKIWRERYAGILPPEQIDYMIEKYQSFPAIKDSVLSHGYEYHAVLGDGGETVGYFGTVAENDALFVSKLYLDACVRGKGLGKRCIEKCAEIARGKGLYKLRLTVNRKNPSFGFYKKIGFTVVREEDTDIGNGFYMNDYVMEYNL